MGEEECDCLSSTAAWGASETSRKLVVEQIWKKHFHSYVTSNDLLFHVEKSLYSILHDPLIDKENISDLSLWLFRKIVFLASICLPLLDLLGWDLNSKSKLIV